MNLRGLHDFHAFQVAAVHASCMKILVLLDTGLLVRESPALQRLALHDACENAQDCLTLGSWGLDDTAQC